MFNIILRTYFVPFSVIRMIRPKNCRSKAAYQQNQRIACLREIHETSIHDSSILKSQQGKFSEMRSVISL